MRIAIVDDEILFANTFSKTIKEKLSDLLESLNIFLSAESFLESSRAFDVVFLDIEMPGISGIELAQKYSESNMKIVFVTNRDDLVFEAYNTTSALGFIRKSNLEDDINLIFSRIKRNFQQSMSISVKIGDTITKLKHAGIIYIEKVGHNSVIHTIDSSYTKRTAISDIEYLLAPYGFVRTHVGYIVNLSFVELLNSEGALLSNGKVIPISRKNIKLVKDKFLERNVMLNE